MRHVPRQEWTVDFKEQMKPSGLRTQAGRQEMALGIPKNEGRQSDDKRSWTSQAQPT